MRHLLAVLLVVAVGLAGCAATPAAETATLAASATAPPPPNQPPTAKLAVSKASGTAPLVVNFTVAGADPDGDALAYTLLFGDGSQANGTLLPGTVAHNYTAVGNYTARLTVSDGKAAANATATVAATLPPKLTFFGNTLFGACDPALGTCTTADLLYPFAVPAGVRGLHLWLAWALPVPGFDLDLYVTDASGAVRGSSACLNVAPAPAVPPAADCTRNNTEEFDVAAITPEDAGTWTAHIVQTTGPPLSYTLTVSYS